MTSCGVPKFERRGNSSELVLILHGYTRSRHNLSGIRGIVAGSKPDADILIPNLPFGRYSFASPEGIIISLLGEVDQQWINREAEGKRYDSITFIGHSIGALFARKLYVCACGENKRAPFSPVLNTKLPRAWARHVDRIILLAGMNRGWAINHHLSLSGAIMWTAGTFFGNLLMFFRNGEPIIFTIRRGAIFITELRVQWLLMRRHCVDKGVGDALIIQLLGSIDDMVSPADNIDLISGHDFVYLDVPNSGHSNIVEMDSSSAGVKRAEVFKKALTAPSLMLKEAQTLPSDNPVGEPKTEVTDVVFVIHGIRDEGYWTHKIARRVRETGKAQQRIVATKTSSYGYFPILRFLLPEERKRKTQWFMDQYVEAFALYPNAAFSFVGHSNGTYLLASALKDYRCCVFNRVLFAGSVVRRKYNWEKCISSGQVKEVANYIATADWVVAFFPKAIQMTGIQDLGSAGHDGFTSSAVSQVSYVKGGHGAAIREENWDSIADFILKGGKAEANPELISSTRLPLVFIPGYVAPVIWIVIASALFGVACLIILTHTCWNWREWQTTLLMVSYIYTVLMVLMKL